MRNSVLPALLLLCPIAAWAADQPFDIRPGLWNMVSTVQMSGMPPIPNLDQMTPEQRARIEAAMKNMAGKPQINTTKSCVTHASIDKMISNMSRRNNSCSTKIVDMSASQVKVHVDCTQPSGDMKTNGDIVVQRQDAEHMTGNGTMKTSGNGHTMDMKWSMTGAFLSSDCGNVKPAEGE